MNRTFLLRKGQEFSDLTFLKELDPRERKTKSREGIFLCSCGVIKTLCIENVVKERTKSCGCMNRRMTVERNYRHGKTGTPLYKKWLMIKYRCENPNALAYKNYGGRGITVCDRWKDFEMFYADMHLSYKQHKERFSMRNTTIERIDYDKGYSPDNCRWATMGEQANNTRANRRIQWNGEIYTMSQIARLKGYTPEQLRKRLKRGWDIEKALTLPISTR